MRLLHLVAACLLLAVPSPAHARTRPTPPPLPAQVWIDPAVDLGTSAGMAAGRLNAYTGTDFGCALAPDDDTKCLPAPCPSARMCLTIRWGDFADDSQHARVVPILCSGVCTKAAVIEINPEGPMYAQSGYWTPYHHLRLMMQQMGVYVGLSVRQQCVSWMSAVTCTAEGFTPAEQQHMAGW